MTDLVVGVCAALAGVIFCFGGSVLLRIALPIWGAFAGFAFGAGLMAGFGEDRFLGDVIGWIVGLVFALLFAVLTYSFYAIAVIVTMTSAGFAIGSGVVVAVGIDWSWVAVLIGVLVGALMCIGALLIDVPMLLLAGISAVAGAIGVVAGGMLVTGAMDTADFTGGGFTDQIRDDWWWYLSVVVLAIAGFVVQSLVAVASRRSLRASWMTSTAVSRTPDPA